MAPGDQRSVGPRLHVHVSDAHGRPVEAGLAGWLTRVAPARARGAVNVAVISDQRVRTLNRRFRGIDHATDVLSFPSASPQGTRRTRRQEFGKSRSASVSSASSLVSVFLGDIVIARGVARRQARAAGHPEATELKVLALHGMRRSAPFGCFVLAARRDAQRQTEHERRRSNDGFSHESPCGLQPVTPRPRGRASGLCYRGGPRSARRRRASF